VAVDLGSAKDAVRRFANMSEVRYTRITADAQGTTDHPRSDDVGLFRMVVTKAAYQTHSRSELVQRELSGIGRLDGPNLVMLPTSDELYAIMDRVCHGRNSRPMIPGGINVVENNDNAFVQRRHSREPDEFDVAAINEALRRNFNDSFAEVSQSVAAGKYRLRGREERAINFGDTDDD
jgi:uncharacterized membrane-anchored protein